MTTTSIQIGNAVRITQLPRTGGSTGALVVLAVVLIACGLLLVNLAVRFFGTAREARQRMRD